MKQLTIEEVRKTKIQEIGIQITTKCNFNCKHCFVKNKHINTKDIDINKLKQILDIIELSHVRKILILGGEISLKPTLIKSVLELLKTKCANANIILFSNGSNIKPLIDIVEPFSNLKLGLVLSDTSYHKMNSNYKDIEEEVLPQIPDDIFKLGIETIIDEKLKIFKSDLSDLSKEDMSGIGINASGNIYPDSCIIPDTKSSEDELANIS